MGRRVARPARIATLVLAAGCAAPALAQSPPSIGKAFNPTSILVNSTTSLTFTISNPNAATTLLGVAFTDILPVGLTIPNASATVCAGTVTLSAPRTITMSGATIAANGQCVFSLTVTGASAGQYTNTTGNVTSSNGGIGNSASANLTVTTPVPPSIAMAFVPSSISRHASTSLNFTITNSNAALTLTGVAFTNTLPAGLTVPNASANVCGGMVTLTAPNGIAMSGVSIGANSQCPFSVTVTGTVAGQFFNTTSNVASTNGGTGNSASASLTVTPSRSHDFNNDGFSEILLANTGGGIALWVMGANAAVQAAVGVGSTTPNVWTVVGQRDLNGDGRADILFRATDGSIAEWLINSNGTIMSANGLGNPTTAWTIVGTGDFNNDGIGDVLFRGGGVAVAIWYMNSNGGLATAIGVGSLPSDWIVAGTGDFNGDGVWDILWFNTTSKGVATWLMNANGTIKSAVAVGSLPAGWTLAGTGDFDGDGISDILLGNSGNGVAIWFVNNSGGIASVQGVGTMGAGWTIAQTGDFNGDGKADILWYNASSGGAIATWLMNAAAVAGAVGIGAIPPASWTILSANSD